MKIVMIRRTLLPAFKFVVRSSAILRSGASTVERVLKIVRANEFFNRTARSPVFRNEKKRSSDVEAAVQGDRGSDAVLFPPESRGTTAVTLYVTCFQPPSTPQPCGNDCES